jgi:putative ABC transport system permease protein
VSHLRSPDSLRELRRPRFAHWILSLGVRSVDERDMILGDLQEEAPRRGAAWCAREAAAISAHAIARRFARPPVAQPSGDFFMKTWLKDVRYGWRGLWKRPLVTLTVAVTLALGLGANAAIFNLIDRLVLRPFPFADPDKSVMLAETGPGMQFAKESVSPANFLDWRAQADTLLDLSAMGWWDANLLERNDPERVQGFLVSAAFFDALGVRPALGRGFVRDDETFGRHHVVVLSDTLWKRRFDGDPSIVGRRVTIDGEPYQVVGVAPPRFQFPDGASLWAPLSFDPKTAPRRDARWLTVVGRLAPGRTFDEAASQMTVIATRLAQQYPDANRDHGVRTYTLSQGMMDEGIGPILSMWQASAFVVLLIACANIANLLLARAAERRRDIAVRLALGASRPRIIRELLTESVLLGAVAVPPAIGFAWLGLYLMRVAMPANIIRFVPGWESLGPDFRLLAFTMGLALLTACIFGTLPALQASRSNVSDSLKEGGRTATGRQFLRRAIVVAEIAIALPLLVAAGLGVLGTNRYLNGPQGYNPDGLLTMRLVLPDRTYPDAAARRQFVARALDAVAAVPGVADTAIVNNAPAAGSNATRTIEIDGHPAPDPKNLPDVDYRAATPDYFTVMQMPILRGRAFTSADREDAAPVAIVTESLANKYWPGEDPIGRRLRLSGRDWITVVGISGDFIQDWFMRRNAPTVYRPIAQAPTDYFGVMVRTAGEPAGFAAAVRQALLRVDPNQPVFDLMTMRRSLHERTIGLQYLAGIMGTFAILGLVLAAVGLYAVIAYLVAQRRHEIGLRIALGASATDVVRLTVGQAFRLTLVGTAIGLALSIALARLMETGLLGIATSDASVFAGFAAVLMAAALLAGYLPARRAAAIDPMIALRAE